MKVTVVTCQKHLRDAELGGVAQDTLSFGLQTVQNGLAVKKSCLLPLYQIYVDTVESLKRI